MAVTKFSMTSLPRLIGYFLPLVIGQLFILTLVTVAILARERQWRIYRGLLKNFGEVFAKGYTSAQIPSLVFGIAVGLAIAWLILHFLLKAL